MYAGHPLHLLRMDRVGLVTRKLQFLCMYPHQG
jgi:hypothetical protein